MTDIAPAISEKLTNLKIITQKLVDSLNVATSLSAMWDSANEDAELLLLFHHTHEGFGLRYVRYSILVRLIVTVTKMHDAYDPNNKNTHNRASIPHLVSILGSPNIQECLAEEAKDWHPDGFLAEGNVRVVTERIKGIFSNSELLKGEEYKKWLTSLRGVRNTDIAHNLFNTDFSKPKFDHLNKILSLSSEIITDSRLAILGVESNYNQTRHVELKKADAFWETLKAGMRLNKKSQPD